MSEGPNDSKPKVGVGPVVAQVLLTGSLMGQAAAIRHVGQATAQGFRPSLLAILYHAGSFRAAPRPIQAASLALVGAKMAVDKVGGLPGPVDLLKYGQEYFKTPIEDLKSYFKANE